MSSAGRNLLNANTGPQDAFLWNNQNSPFLPVGWEGVAIHFKEKREITPVIEATAPGGKTVFHLEDTLSDYMGEIVLRWTNSAVTAGSGATFTEYVDYAAIASIGSIELRYGSNHLQTIRPVQLHAYDYSMVKDREEQLSEDELMLGNKTQTERRTAAAAARTFYLRIPTWWITDTHKYLPISCLSNELNIQINWASIDKVIRTDASTNPSLSMSSTVLISTLIHVSSQEQSAIQIDSDQDEGLMYCVHDFSDIHEEILLASGSSSFTVQLQNIRSPVVELLFVVRKDSEVNSTTLRNDPFNYQAISTFKLKGSGLDIVRDVARTENQFIDFPDYHSGVAGSNINLIVHSLNPEDRRDQWGSLNYFNINNATLTITFAANLAENHVLDVIGVTKNIMQIKSGDIKKFFV